MDAQKHDKEINHVRPTDIPTMGMNMRSLHLDLGEVNIFRDSGDLLIQVTFIVIVRPLTSWLSHHRESTCPRFLRFLIASFEYYP